MVTGRVGVTRSSVAPKPDVPIPMPKDSPSAVSTSRSSPRVPADWVTPLSAGLTVTGLAVARSITISVSPVTATSGSTPAVMVLPERSPPKAIAITDHRPGAAR